MRIVINGAGIAGPTLAYWLRESGHEVLLIEESPRLRSGGYVIDFWGVGYDITERMGLLPQIRELGYQVSEVRFMDRLGRKRGGFSTDVFRPHDERPCGCQFLRISSSGGTYATTSSCPTMPPTGEADELNDAVCCGRTDAVHLMP